MLISIVVPVYGSTVVEELVDRVEAIFSARPERCEIILVEDAWPDPKVWQSLSSLAGRKQSVVAIQLTRNFGQHAATLCGLRESKGDWVVTIDDDLQHAPEDIPKLLAASEHEAVFGQFPTVRQSLSRRLSSWTKAWFDAVILNKPKNIRLSSFRLLSRAVVDGMLLIRTPYPFIPSLIFDVTRDVAGVEVTHYARRSGRSGYTFPRRFALFKNLVIHNSAFVLGLVGKVGIIFSACSFILAALVVYEKLADGVAIAGWTSLLATQLLVGGLLLFSVGLAGEYLIHIIASSECRPTYFVRRRRGNPPAAPMTESNVPSSR